MTVQKQKKKQPLMKDSYIQMFMYVIAKKNSVAWIEFQKKFTAMLAKNGTLHSEFYKFESSEIFSGFESISSKVSLHENTEELWMEIDHYNDAEHKNTVVQNVNNDQEAGPLFGQLMNLVTKEKQIIMGEFIK